MNPQGYVSWLGVAMVLLGEAVRKTGMVGAAGTTRSKPAHTRPQLGSWRCRQAPRSKELTPLVHILDLQITAQTNFTHHIRTRKRPQHGAA